MTFKAKIHTTILLTGLMMNITVSTLLILYYFFYSAK